jgi:LPS export ABC transporter protein LptC
MSGLRRGLPTILSETGFGCNGRLAASRDGISVYPARQICLSVRACVKNRNPHLLILVLTAASVIACRGESKFVPELAHSDLVRGADATLRNFTAEAFRKGAMLYRVAAQQGYIVQVKDETHLYDLRIEYFETNRKSKDFGKATIVTAKECKMEQGNRFMTIRGDVLVEAPHGRKLKTQELFWDEAKNSLYSNMPVTVQDGSGNVLTGTRGIVTDRSLSRTVFKGGVGAGNGGF